MSPEGSAFIDRSGRLVASDPGFRSCLSLTGDDPTPDLARRAAADPVLSGLLSGAGPDRVVLPGSDGRPGCELSRVGSEAGFLLRARAAGAPFPPPEHAMFAAALSRLAGSVAHEVKNPLNAMALQLALLSDKIATSSDALATACAGNLGSLKNQIGRVNDVVRRFLDVADPAPSVGFDGGSLLADIAALFGHEGRRRRVAVSCDPATEGVRAAGDPARAARLLVGLFLRELTSTPEGGRLVAHASASGGEAVLAVQHERGPRDPTLAWIGPVLDAGAAEMGGRLDATASGDNMRAALVLPRERVL